jgi:hypothetical protein
MVQGLEYGTRVIFEDYLQQELPEPTRRRPRRFILNHKAVKTLTKILSILSTFIFAVVTLGTFTLVGSFFQKRKMMKMEPNSPSSKKQYQWVKPLIKKNANDPDTIEGEYLKTEIVRDAQGRMVLERRAPKKVATTKEAAVLFDKKNMSDLIKGLFDWAFDDIKKKAKSRLAYDELTSTFREGSAANAPNCSLDNVKEALYHWMIFFLAKNGGLETSCDKSSRWLVINQSLKIAPSEACHVLTEDGLSTKTFFLNEDEWSPSPEAGVNEGIDPISLKWIIGRLSDDHAVLKHLETLLLEPLISDNDQNLKKAKQFLQRDGKKSQLVKYALALVHDMSKVLRTNFSKTIEECWRGKEIGNRTKTRSTSKKIVKYPSFTTPITWNKETRRLQRVQQIAIKIVAVVGYALGNLLTLGMLSFAVTIYQHEKLNSLKATKEKNDDPLNITKMWIKSQYEKKVEDPDEIPVNEDRLGEVIAPKEANDVDTMGGLITASFDHTFKSLLEMSSKKVWNVHFNSSSKIFNETIQVEGGYGYRYQDNMNSVYNLMVFNLLEAGGLIQEAGDHRVKFNDHLSVGYSKPCRVQNRENNSQVTFFLNNDAWTPLQNDNVEALNGVDPIGAKWIIEKLKNNTTALNHLKVLLLNGLIPDASDYLTQAKYFIVDDERGHLVKTAYELISTMALVVAKKYSPIIQERWDALTNDDTPEDPLQKEGVFVLNPNGNEEEWMPPSYLPNDFLVEEIIKTKTLITPIWKEIDQVKLADDEIEDRENKILPLDISHALEFLSRQYYWIHAGIQTHGCLLSALTTHLYQGSEEGNNNFDPSTIKNAMAEYLIQQPEGFEAEISQSTAFRNRQGWTVDEYYNWLITGGSPPGKKARTNQDMGDLEMELFSKTFDIQLAVFELGKPYLLLDGLMVPNRTFGPNTKEKFILLNKPGFTFYALMPRCRDSKEGDREEIKESLKHVHDFWGENNRTEYGSRIYARPRGQPR